MNRAQRRQKQKPVRVINKAAAWQNIEGRIRLSETNPLTEQQINDILVPAYQWLTNLQFGCMNVDQYVSMIEVNCAAFSLAARIYGAATSDEAKQQIKRSEKAFNDAAEALNNVGGRFGATGKFGATGDELNAVRESVDWYRELLPFATTGLAEQAVNRAREMVNDELLKTARKNGIIK